MKEVISTTRAPGAIGPYSQAIRKGPRLFVSGQLGVDPATGNLISDDVEDQTRQALANLLAIVMEAGTNLSNVVKTTVFLTDMDDFAKVNEIYGQVFNVEPPARSCIAVKALPKGAKVEIEAIAFI